MSRLILNTFAQVGAIYRRRIVLKQLSGLEDHMLKDIGLSRADIYRVASGQAMAR